MAKTFNVTQVISFSKCNRKAEVICSLGTKHIRLVGTGKAKLWVDKDGAQYNLPKQVIGPGSAQPCYPSVQKIKLLLFSETHVSMKQDYRA